MRKKLHALHSIFRSYYRYCSHYYYCMMTVVMTVATRHGYNDIVTTVVATVVMTVVTTVVAENCMPMHTTFFSHVGCAMSGNNFFKNRIDFAHRVLLSRASRHLACLSVK